MEPNSLGSFVETYGLVAIAVGTFFEGETILLLGGLAAHRGYLSLDSVVVAGFVGTFAGDQLYFYVGRRHGRTFLAKRPKWAARAQRAQRILERHHVIFILGFRFLYGLRTVSPFVIGMSGVEFYRYLLLNMLGGAIWSLAVALVGYSVGEGAEVLLGQVKEFELWLFLGTACVGSVVWLGYLVQCRRQRGRKSDVESTGGL